MPRFNYNAEPLARTCKQCGVMTIRGHTCLSPTYPTVIHVKCNHGAVNKKRKRSNKKRQRSRIRQQKFKENKIKMCAARNNFKQPNSNIVKTSTNNNFSEDSEDDSIKLTGENKKQTYVDRESPCAKKETVNNLSTEEKNLISNPFIEEKKPQINDGESSSNYSSDSEYSTTESVDMPNLVRPNMSDTIILDKELKEAMNIITAGQIVNQKLLEMLNANISAKKK